MDTHPPVYQENPAPDPAADTAWHRPMLRHLADLALELAQHIQRQAIAQASPEASPAAPPTPTSAADRFIRVARAARQIIACDARAAAGTLGDPGLPGRCVAEQNRRETTEQRRKTLRRTLVREEVVAAIDQSFPDDREALLRDLDLRLADDDLDEALGVRSLDEIVRALCEEFGVCRDCDVMSDDQLRATMVRLTAQMEHEAAARRREHASAQALPAAPPARRPEPPS